MLRLLTLSVFILACGAAVGCADDEPPTTPVETPTPIVETLTGTVTILGASSHVFTTERAGQAEVKITSLAPDSGAIVTLMFGTWNGVSCKVEFVKDDASTGTTFVANASIGVFCVRISDTGGLFQPTNYTITATHF